MTDTTVLAPDAQPRTRTRHPGRLVGYLALVAATATAAALLPNWFVEPMDGMTNFMGLAGPSNPLPPKLGPQPVLGLWFFLLPALPVFGLVYPFLGEWLPLRAAKLGIVVFAVIGASICGYLLRWGLWPRLFGAEDWHGTMDVVSLGGYAAYALFAVPAAAIIVAVGELTRRAKRLFLVSAAVWHLGMVPAMLAANFLGGPPAHEHAEALAVLALVRWA